MIHLLMVLYVLAVLDAMFSGICAASGRNALIHKGGYYARSMLYGFAWGQAACLAGLAILAATVAASDDPQQTVAEMVAVGERMALVYGAYAAVVLATFAVRAVPSVDVRSITSVVAFGPLTFLRPYVIVAGLVWGLLLRPSLPVAGAAIQVALLMIPFRIWLNRMIDLHGVELLHPHRGDELVQ